MPRIPDEYLESVVFLYRNEEAGREGENAGGCGFIIDLDGFQSGGHPLRYLCTNQHVVGEGFRTIRVNTSDGVAFQDIPEEDWVRHSDGDDVAVALIASPLRPFPNNWRVIGLSWKAIMGTDVQSTLRRMGELNVGVGDDVFMVGRFLPQDEKGSNSPVARFGNIAMMPDSLVKDGRGLRVQAFLVEMRSLSGFSGSPVFCYMAPGSHRGNQNWPEVGGGAAMGFLGIDCGHMVASAPVIRRGTKEPVDREWEVPQNSGAAIVVPFWKVADVLAQPETQGKRAAEKAKWINSDKIDFPTIDIGLEDKGSDQFKKLAEGILQVSKDEIEN